MKKKLLLNKLVLPTNVLKLSGKRILIDTESILRHPNTCIRI